MAFLKPQQRMRNVSGLPVLHILLGEFRLLHAPGVKCEGPVKGGPRGDNVTSNINTFTGIFRAPSNRDFSYSVL